jgi:serine/threonine protein kinase
MAPSSKPENGYGPYPVSEGADTLDGKYLIEHLLGQGGMGAVYRAVHVGTKRTVAIKIIHPQLVSNEEFVERFRREAEATGRLRHPNVVDVTDFGFARTRSGQVAYLVMEYLDGCTLADVLAEERRLSNAWVVDILDQVSSAVDEAHRLGIVHRDLKPENIWLEPNRRGGYTVKVLDFGLAKLGDRAEPAAAPAAPMPSQADAATLVQPALQTIAAGLTRAGSVMGTPLYMSPEQCRGEPLDARSDIYSLGVIAYRMLTGETPFAGDPAALVRLHCSAAPQPVGEKGVRVPKRMAALVMAALAKSADARPQTAAGFRSALRASAEGSGTLLRHAVSLYSEHFPAFLQMSLVAYVPLMAFLAWFAITDIQQNELSPEARAIVGPIIFLAIVGLNLFAYAAVAALAAPVVVQLTIAPLRQVRPRTAFAALTRRWRTFSAATTAVVAMTLAGTVLLVIPGIVSAVWHALYAPVAVMENLGVGATLARARRLARRFWSTVVIITALQFALPVLVWVLSVDSSFELKFDEHYNPTQFGFGFSTSGSSALYQLLNILVAPLTAIMSAQLYMKTRQAGGEVLRDALDQFEELEIPRSNWQSRIRTERRGRGNDSDPLKSPP